MTTLETEKPAELLRPAAQAAWVLRFLEPDQLSGAKMRYGQRKLSRGTVLLLWGLRLYVVLMVVIVALAIRNALHGIS